MRCCPRRTLALAVLLASLAAACSNDDSGQAAAAPTSTTPATTTTTSIPPGGRQPTTGDPLRVTFVGDSVMSELATAMIPSLEGTGQSAVRFVLAPSLARSGADRVVWNQELRDQDPDLIVLLVGLWEDSIVQETASGDPGWPERYRTEVVDPFLDLVTSQGAKVLWIGMAAVDDPVVTARFARLNSVFSQAADERDDIDFLAAGEYLAAPDGGFTEIGTSSVTGAPVRWRRIDGIHLCPGGVEVLGQPVLDRINRQWNVSAAYGWQQGSWREPPLFQKPEECPAPT